MKLERLLRQYDYHVPPALVAQQPARPRDSARLFAYDRRTKRTHVDTFRNLGRYLPPRAVLVFNQTKVLPARLTLTKPTGGKVRVLYTAMVGQRVRVLADRALQPGDVLRLTQRHAFTVLRRDGDAWLLTPSFGVASLHQVLDRYGVAPLPPYIKHSPLTEAERKAQYQTVFAKRRGSVAAPTASLHFTKRLLAQLERQGFGVQYVTLHVNLGTFAPLTAAQIAAHQLHAEQLEVTPATARALNAARRQGRPIVAVGTTVVRTLESACDRQGRIRATTRATRLFIQPGFRFRVVDGVVTNFHVPRSSLLMLVAAFATRPTTMRLYRAAIRKRFRLFSFGDAMCIT